MSQRDLVLVKEAVGVGDHRAYVGGVHAEGTTVLSRQALHATKISFSHPTEKKQMNLVAPLYKVLLCPHAVIPRGVGSRSYRTHRSALRPTPHNQFCT